MVVSLAASNSGPSAPLSSWALTQMPPVESGVPNLGEGPAVIWENVLNLVSGALEGNNETGAEHLINEFVLLDAGLQVALRSVIDNKASNASGRTM